MPQNNHKRATATASIPSSPSFQERMLGVVQKENTKVRIAKQRQSLPSNLVQVETLEEYKEVVSSNSLVVVRFYAPWCRACKAIQPIFYKMAHQFPSVTFVDVACTDKNANLHTGLKVPSLPFCHIYQNGLVEESKLQRKEFPQLARKLQSYLQGRCDLNQAGDPTSPYEKEETTRP